MLPYVEQCMKELIKMVSFSTHGKHARFLEVLNTFIASFMFYSHSQKKGVTALRLKIKSCNRLFRQTHGTKSCWLKLVI